VAALELRCVYAVVSQTYDYPDYAYNPPERIKNANAALNAFGWDDTTASAN
jgi:hypothetical protein